MKKALIIDDERLARSELKKLLADHPEIVVVGEAVNAKDGHGKDRIAAARPAVPGHPDAG